MLNLHWFVPDAIAIRGYINIFDVAVSGGSGYHRRRPVCGFCFAPCLLACLASLWFDLGPQDRARAPQLRAGPTEDSRFFLALLLRI